MQQNTMNAKNSISDAALVVKENYSFLEKNQSIINGHNNYVRGDRNVVNGNNNTVKGNNNVVNGRGNKIFGNNCVCEGKNNTAEGENCIIINACQKKGRKRRNQRADDDGDDDDVQLIHPPVQNVQRIARADAETNNNNNNNNDNNNNLNNALRLASGAVRHVNGIEVIREFMACAAERRLLERARDRDRDRDRDDDTPSPFVAYLLRGAENRMSASVQQNKRTVFPKPWADEPEVSDHGAPSCVVCMTRAPAVAAVPCGHLDLCVSCCCEMEKKLEAGKKATCAVCREPVDTYVRLFAQEPAQKSQFAQKIK
jgi:Zinc finger, C3HC4 type (RING finger)